MLNPLLFDAGESRLRRSGELKRRPHKLHPDLSIIALYSPCTTEPCIFHIRRTGLTVFRSLPPAIPLSTLQYVSPTAAIHWAAHHLAACRIKHAEWEAFLMENEQSAGISCSPSPRTPRSRGPCCPHPPVGYLHSVRGTAGRWWRCRGGGSRRHNERTALGAQEGTRAMRTWVTRILIWSTATTLRIHLPASPLESRLQTPAARSLGSEATHLQACWTQNCAARDLGSNRRPI
ncbi:hypothetical protein B0H17DRAFT_103005 [Mycena rosella]|uniref:Uncharacterized protein n=1 Tax=Mycena rosella TaxID=1033263 RepID=A0AAD7D4W8_MYCRO|nr:hypothetical protein B0H17DRAFT_103005 [Mycena rosella]